MKRFLLLIFTLFPCFSFFVTAQDLTGIWRGYFIDEGLNQYRYEVQMEQTKNNTLSGVTYSYLGRSFYGKSTMTGNFTKSTGNALIQEIKTIEVRMEVGSRTCIQKCLLTYIKSGREEFLEGTFTSIIEKSDTVVGISKRGEDCGGGKMFLRKVTTSDFYIEPFLRKRSLPKTETPGVVKINPPVAKPPVNSPKKNNITKTINRPVNNKNTTIVRPKADSLTKVEIPVIDPQTEKTFTIKKENKVPPIIKSRENNLLQTIIINSDEVIVKLYDNGEIDDDTISVYLDNSLVLSKQRLTATALTIKLKMDEANPDHELIMVAENLGRIPPNTSLMIVNDGDKRYEVRITSTEQKNAVVRFRYVKPG